MQRQIQAYQNAHVLTGTPGDLLLALYDGMGRFCGQAKAAIEDKNPAAKGVAIGRAFDIITELVATLDASRDPKLCADMTTLYNYWFDRLQTASMTMQVGPIDEVIRHVGEMRMTWQQAVSQARQEGIRA